MTSLALVALIALSQADGGVAAAEGKVVQRAPLMKEKPARDFPKVMRSWNVDNDGTALVRLHEVVGTVPMHLHSDSTERIIVIEGKIRMTIGTRVVGLAPGDYVSIPANVQHKVELEKGTKKALVAGINEPPPDPAKTKWIEPAPKPAP